jgi:hypothetical protein
LSAKPRLHPFLAKTSAQAKAQLEGAAAEEGAFHIAHFSISSP